MYSFSLTICLFLALIACVRETKKVSDFVALIFCNLEICDERNQESAQI